MPTAEIMATTSTLTSCEELRALSTPQWGRKRFGWRAIPYLTFALCASLYFLPFMRQLLLGSDEGTLLEGATRVVHGQLLGRDFFEVIGPGTFYWLALFFKIFGVTFFASRICLFVTSLGTALSVYYLSRRVSRHYLVLPSIVVFATYSGWLWPTVSHHVDSNFFALLAVVCMVLWLDLRKNSLLFAAGALAGAAALVLQPKGVLLLLALLVWLWVQRWRRAAGLSALARVTGGFCTVVGLMLGYYWHRGALGDLFYVNVVWPSRNYGTVNSVHYAFGMLEYFNRWRVHGPGMSWTWGLAIVMLIPVLFVAALPGLLVLLGVQQRAKSVHPSILLYWLCGWALFVSELHRKDLCHLVYGAPLLIILCSYYLQESRTKLSDAALQVLYITSVAVAGVHLILAVYARPIATRIGTVHIGKNNPALTVIEEHVPRGGEIFMYPYAPMNYFLTATTNPTRYSFLLYRYNTPSQFQDAIQVLDQHRVRYVLWETTLQDDVFASFFPATKHMRPGDYIMEPYLESHYKQVWIHDGVRLMERKGEGDGN
jgi:hypothetical protein